MFENTPPKKKAIYITLLFVPLVLAITWLIYLKLTQEAVGLGSGEFLSPLNNTPLIVGLVIFTFGYLFFLGMMFSSNIKEAIEEWRRRREE